MYTFAMSYRTLPYSFVVVACIAGTAFATPATVDSLLCRRVDANDKSRTYLTVAEPKQEPNVTADDSGLVTVCQDAAKKQCTSLKKPPYVTYAINATGTLLLASSDKGLLVENAKDGKVVRTITNKRRKNYGCGGGRWLGDMILGFGNDCEEFDTLPYLANGKTGAFVGALVDKRFEANGDTVYRVAPIEGNLWAIGIYNRDAAEGSITDGAVYVIDVVTGKVKGTVTNDKTTGGASIEQGKATRKVAKLAACPS